MNASKRKKILWTALVLLLTGGSVPVHAGKIPSAVSTEDEKGTAEEDSASDEREWAYRVVHAEEAAALGYDGTGVRIAILDSGIRRTHEVFAGACIEAGKDYTGSVSGKTNDYLGHGTMVASLIAAQPGNRLGVKGIAPGAMLIPLKCFNEEQAVVSLLSQAVYDAVDVYKCDIIHMSWGVREPDEKLEAAVEYAAERGVILIAAGGNDGEKGEYYPAGWTDVIGVGAVGRELGKADYSTQSAAVLVNAPGTGIFGAGHTSDRATGLCTGTSYAAAYVTGAAALAVQAVPGISAQELKNAFSASAQTEENRSVGLSADIGVLDIGGLLRELT